KEFVDAKLGAVRIARHVDEQITEEPICEPRRRLPLAVAEFARHFVERELKLVDAVVSRLIDARRLRRWSDEHVREQVRERGMLVKVRNEASKEIGTPQERRIKSRGPAENDVIAATGPHVTAVVHELLGTQPRQARSFV